MNNSEKKYKYGQKLRTAIFAVLFFGICTIVLIYKAQNNDQGVIINGLIELSRENATIFYWVLCVFSLGFVLTGLFTLYLGLRYKYFLILKPDLIIIPPVGFRRKTTVIKYADIINIKETQVNNIKFLTLYHKTGKRAIISNLLPKKAHFQEVKEEIIQ